jgi:molybdate transport system substrate-binding protein
MRIAHRAISAVLSVALLLAACGPRDAAPELLVAAASDLAGAMPELAAGFEAETGIRVVATLGSSGQIAQQILQGAPVDVFLSADRIWVERLAEAGRVAPDGRALYARGRLALITASGRAQVETLDALADPGVRRIAIANPEHAPYGRAAREALASAGVLEGVADRLVFGENVRQALQFVATGNVDAAIAALSLVDAMTPPWTVVPEALHQPLLQEGAVVAGRPNGAAAAAFLRYLTSDAGREILVGYRFELPDPPR